MNLIGRTLKGLGRQREALTPARALFNRGNALRDARDWSGAADAYAAYLDLHPGDRAITIQRGHMVKEAGDPATALSLYRAAEAMLPEDPDIHIQIGHALKLLRRLPEAARAYRIAAELDPAAVDPWRELAMLQSLGVASPWRPKGAPDTPPGALLDISDLLSWIHTRRVPSGIQRVQLAIAGAALEGGMDAALVAMRAGAAGFVAVPALWFSRLQAVMRRGADAEDAEFRQIVEVMEAVLAGPLIAFTPGQILLTLGTAWWLPGYLDVIRAARTDAGLRHVALVHDVGPIVAPRDVSPGAGAQFARWFAGLALHADGLLVAGSGTAEDIAGLGGGGLPQVPIEVVPFDAAPHWPRPAETHPLLEQPGPFVLWVGSLETRKDHAFVFAAWKRLAERMGRATPRLVCVGRAAEGSATALGMLAADPALAARISVVQDADDALLVALLRRARFILYHSRHEGWGLPVTEALAAGKPVVIPDLPGLRDAARGLAETFRPGDAEGLVDLLHRLSGDDAALAASAARIAAAPPLRSWTEVAADILGAAQRLASQDASEAKVDILLAPGSRLTFGEDPNVIDFASLALASLVRDRKGWMVAEGWGVWARLGYARITLPIAPTLTAPQLHLELEAPSKDMVLTIRVDRDGASGAWCSIPITEAGPCFAAVAAPVGDGPLSVLLVSDRPDADQDERGIGVVALTVFADDAPLARIEAMERRVFRSAVLS
ncbi:glycosyltransferase involved in cell wall biosynthesis [Humitalea rosea]|uniref:Glycosyltransferase involved in cell wall biosynthesis n=1 Tax=Humitalea rosea TaxID=990373 RepID=A0A2W7IT96_9PROT|nr:glycosyltransferase [Humitalea rosea]PZW41893.1 glycosyltransferase involved in cell wall biosynthesis [Humitalea rosea]